MASPPPARPSSPAQAPQVRAGERRKVLLMTATVLALLAAHTLVEPVAHSLFLVEWGAARLPWLYLASIVPGAAVAALYARFARSERIERIILASLAIFASNLVVFRWALALGIDATKPVLYLWTNVFGVLATSQFWLLANHLFDAREAKRAFGVIGMGAIGGGVLGGSLASRLAHTLGSEDLLLVAVGFIALAAVLTRIIARSERATLAARHVEARKEAILAGGADQGAWPAIRRSRHLKLLVALGAASVFAATIVDYLFKTVAALAHPGQDDLTSFLGFFQASLSVASFFLQLALLAVWSPLLRTLGVIGALAILPAVLLTGASALVVSPQLMTAAAVKAADASLRYSLHRSTVELLFLPVPIDVRRRTKAFVDLFGERFARAAAGIVLLALVALGLGGPRPLAAALGIAAVALALVIARLGKTYLAALRSTVAGRGLDLDRETVTALDAAAIEVLRRALSEDSARQVTYALDVLGSAGDQGVTPHLKPLLLRVEPEIRLRALELLHRFGGPEDRSDVEPLLDDPDDPVRAAAVRFLCEHGGESATLRFLEHADVRLRAVALGHMIERTGERSAAPGRERLEAALKESGPGRALVRREIAGALARAADPRFAALLVDLIDDPDLPTALAAIEAAGRTRDPILVPLLFSRLATARLREAARRALAEYGEPLLPAIEHALNDPARDSAVRNALPRLLADIGSERSTALLVRHLRDPDLDLRHAALKALGRLGAGNLRRTIDGRAVEREILEEARLHFEILATLHGAQPRTPGPARNLLSRALREQLDRSLERIFRLLGLRYPPRDIFHIYRKVVSGPMTQRASALELLDNLLHPDLKRVIFPIVEPPSIEAALEAGRRLFQVPSGSLAHGLRRLATGQDAWLRQIAVHVAGAEQIGEMKDLCEEAAGDPDPALREEGRRALARLVHPAAGEGSR